MTATVCVAGTLSAGLRSCAQPQRVGQRAGIVRPAQAVPRRCRDTVLRVCANGAASSSGGGWSWPGGAPAADVAAQWRRGVADCGASSCGVAVPDGALVLVREGPEPSCAPDVLGALARGVVLSDDRPLIVGSQPSTRINYLVDSPAVSARHARIESVPPRDAGRGFATMLGPTAPWLQKVPRPRPSTLYCTDLGSEGGTYVNGVPLVPLLPVELSAGDVVAFGSPSTAFRIVRATARRGWFN